MSITNEVLEIEDTLNKKIKNILLFLDIKQYKKTTRKLNLELDSGMGAYTKKSRQ